MSIYTVKSSKSPILQVQSVCAIFGLDYNTFYIETEISSLNSSQSESRFCKKHFIGRRFSNGENSFWRWTTPESLSLTPKIYIYQDKYPLEISSPPDEESCETAIRLLIDMSIYTVKSLKSPILQVQSVCAIFGLDYNTFYIETEVSSLNSSQSESEFCKSTLLGRGFQTERILFDAGQLRRV